MEVEIGILPDCIKDKLSEYIRNAPKPCYNEDGTILEVHSLRLLLTGQMKMRKKVRDYGNITIRSINGNCENSRIYSHIKQSV